MQAKPTGHSKPRPLKCSSLRTHSLVSRIGCHDTKARLHTRYESQAPASSGMRVLDVHGATGSCRLQFRRDLPARATPAIGHGRPIQEDDRAAHRQSHRNHTRTRRSDHSGPRTRLPDRAALQGWIDRQERRPPARDRSEAVPGRPRSGRKPSLPQPKQLLKKGSLPRQSRFQRPPWLWTRHSFAWTRSRSAASAFCSRARPRPRKTTTRPRPRSSRVPPESKPTRLQLDQSIADFKIDIESAKAEIDQARGRARRRQHQSGLLQDVRPDLGKDRRAEGEGGQPGRRRRLDRAGHDRAARPDGPRRPAPCATCRKQPPCSAPE